MNFVTSGNFPHWARVLEIKSHWYTRCVLAFVVKCTALTAIAHVAKMWTLTDAHIDALFVDFLSLSGSVTCVSLQLQTLCRTARISMTGLWLYACVCVCVWNVTRSSRHSLVTWLILTDYSRMTCENSNNQTTNSLLFCMSGTNAIWATRHNDNIYRHCYHRQSGLKFSMGNLIVVEDDCDDVIDCICRRARVMSICKSTRIVHTFIHWKSNYQLLPPLLFTSFYSSHFLFLFLILQNIDWTHLWSAWLRYQPMQTKV